MLILEVCVCVCSRSCSYEQLFVSLCFLQETEFVGLIRRSSTYEMLPGVDPGVAGCRVDKIDMECEYTNLHSEASCLNASAAGPGLDSDFGASAGTFPHNDHHYNNFTVYKCLQ